MNHGIPDTADFPVPLVVEVRRRALRGALADPRPWLDALVGDLPVDSILAAFERDLAASDRGFDVGRWASEDSPEAEVHMLDPVGDMIGALNWILLVRGAGELDIGSGLLGLEPSVRRQVETLTVESQRIGELLRLPDAAQRAEKLKSAWEFGLATARAREQAALRSAPIDQDFVAAVEASANEHRSAQMLRTLLITRGVVRFEAAQPPEEAVHPFKNFVPKGFFARDPRSAASADDFGSSFAAGLGLRETWALVRGLLGMPIASLASTGLLDRLSEALEILAAGDVRPDAVLLPGASDQMVELNSDERFCPAYPREVDGSIGTFLDVPVYVLPPSDLEQGWVLEIARAVRETVYADDRRVVHVSARDATRDELADHFSSQPAGEQRIATETVYATVAVSEAFEFQFRADAVLGIPLGLARGHTTPASPDS